MYSVDPRFVFFDMSAAKFEDIRYLIEVTVLTKSEYKRRTKKNGRKGALYNNKVSGKSRVRRIPPRSSKTTLVTRVTSTKHQLTYIVGLRSTRCMISRAKAGTTTSSKMLKNRFFEGELPYRYIRNPFISLTFNENMTDLAGLSDVKLVQSLQQRLNEIDTLELWHAHTSTPVMLVNTALADNPEAILTALQDANQPGTMVSIQGKANAPLGDIIGQTPVPSFSPAFTDMRNRCNQVIEFILGIPQYSRGVVGVADVATEVALADTATRTRKRTKNKAD